MFTVTSDQFGLALSYALQLKDKTQEKLSEFIDVIKKYDAGREDGYKYTIDISRDHAIVEELFNKIRSIVAPADYSDKPANFANKITIGKKVCIDFKNFNITDVRSQIQQLKVGDETIQMTFNVIDEEFEDKLGLKTLSLKKSG